MTARAVSPVRLSFWGALALRVGWIALAHFGIAASTEAGAGAFRYDDERVHWQLASNLAQRGTLVTDDGRFAARMPAYPLFLTAFAWFGFGGLLAARFAQAVVGALTAALAARFAGETFGRRSAWAAGMMVACDPFGVFFANLLLTEVLFTFIAIAFTYFVWLSSAWGTPDRAGHSQVHSTSQTHFARAAPIGAALLGAVAVLTRPSALGWVVIAWLIGASGTGRVRAARRLALGLVVLVALLLPWGIRNRLVIGDFSWLSTNGGVTLYDGQGPQARGDSDQSFLQTMPGIAALDEVARDRALRDLAIAQIRNDPGRAAELAVTKFARMWSPTPNVSEYRQGAIATIGAIFTVAVLVGAAVGLWRIRGQRWLIALLVAPVAYFTLVHCLYVGSVRYRVPLMPFLAIAAAAAIPASRQACALHDRSETAGVHVT